jgi:hypothetical protein
MSRKMTGRLFVGKRSSPLFEAVALSTRLPSSSTSANRPFITGSTTLTGNGSTEWTGTIARIPHGHPLGPLPPSRNWS